MPNEVKDIMQYIISKSYEVYIVGGYVRDYLLNIENKDYDLVTNMPLEELKKGYPTLHIMKENSHRNTSILYINNLSIEISTYKGNSLKEDLSNRDFTINALALDINNNLIDPSNYQEDLNNRILKVVKEDGSGIDYDPLRILRALRISLSHKLIISPNTKKIILLKKELLTTVAKERIYNELTKILMYKEATKYIDEYKEIFFIIIPKLKETYNFQQHNKYHIYDVFYHTLKVIDCVEANIYLKLTALFHDLGKPDKFFIGEDGIGHFYGHWITSRKIFKSFCKEYKVDKTTESIVSLLILNHDRLLPSKRKKIIKFLQVFNPSYLDMLFKIKRADILAQNPVYQEESLLKLEEQIKRIAEILKEKPVLTEKDLAITGNDLIKLGYQGKDIGIIKKKLIVLINGNRVNNNKCDIIDYIKKEKK